MGVAGVIDMAGTLFEVWRDRAGFGPLSRSGDWFGVGNFSDVPGSGEEMMIGIKSLRGRDRDLRRGGEGAGGSFISLLDGERPRCGLDEEHDVSPKDRTKRRTRGGG